MTGSRPSGSPVPGKYKWAGNRKRSDGFPENAVFYDLVYEDPDSIEVGARFEAILPALWFAAGSVSDPARLSHGPSWMLADDFTFGVLLDEDRFAQFAAAVRERDDLTHVWLVTDSLAAFAGMRGELSPQLEVGMLYRDYLRNFRINTDARR